FGTVAPVFLGDFQQRLGGTGMLVEDHVLDAVTQAQRNLVVDFQLAGVDDAHVQAVFNRVIQEYRVDCLAHRVVATERKRHVGYTAGGQRIGEVVANPGHGLDEVHGVVVVFLNTGGHGKDVGIENDVFRRETDLIDQNIVGAGANFVFTRCCICLTLFVKRHHDYGRAIAAAQFGVLDKFVYAFLHGNRVDDALALNALETSLDNFPLG